MAFVSSAPLHAGEVRMSLAGARALVDAQFPTWRALPITPVSSTGTDNVIFRLGSEIGLRFPLIDWAVEQVAHEMQWLPPLAGQLELETPMVLATGAPGGGYPWPWLAYRWLDGDCAPDIAVPDEVQLATDLARFLGTLRAARLEGAPVAHGVQRGAPLAAFDADARDALDALRGEVDHARCLAVWESAVAAPPWRASPVWVHGDLLPGNLILREGRLVGVIDWAASRRGDPACDLMAAWSLGSQARAVLRRAVAEADAEAVDDATWTRGRGWAILQAASFIPYYRDTIPAAVASARRRLDAAAAG
jgi:aminoglycoside phosphotransferase (APT) family kinase protein